MKILMLCGEIPFPPHGGSRRRVYQFIRALAERHAITLLAYQYTREEDVPIDALKGWCQVEAVRWQEPPAFKQMRSSRASAARLAFGRALLLDPAPFVAQYFRARSMRERLCERLAREPFDLIHVEDTAMMTLLPDRVHLPIVLSIQNVESWREARAKPATLAQRIELAKLREYERRMFRRASVCCPTSPMEAEQISRLAPAARIQVVANGVDTREFSPGGTKSARPLIVFSGTLSYAPNADGILWFVRAVLPLIQKEIGPVCLDIVGREPPDEIRALASEHVQVAGDVPEVSPMMRRAWVAIAPIREGGGTRLKILEALACALPVVSTAIGAEGLAVTHAKNILIADDAPAFARETIRVLCDPARRDALGGAGRALVAQNYDWSGITRTLEQVYLSVKTKP